MTAITVNAALETGKQKVYKVSGVKWENYKRQVQESDKENALKYSEFAGIHLMLMYCDETEVKAMWADVFPNRVAEVA